MLKKLLLATTALLALTSVARADIIVDDPLHGECTGCTEQTIGGDKVTPISAVTNFGFSSSPAGATGNLELKFLIPDSFTLTQVNNFASQVNVTGTGGPFSLSLFSTTAWTSGFLETDYLHNTLATGAPKNPLDAFIGATNTLDPTADGYYVLLAETGQHTLGGPGDPLSAANKFSLDPAVFAQGGLILGNLFTRDGDISTAQSGALFFNGPNGGPFCVNCVGPVPEISTWAMMILGFFGVGFMAYRSRHNGSNSLRLVS